MRLLLSFIRLGLVNAVFFVQIFSAKAAITIGKNFTGAIYGITSDGLPADAGGAVGPGHFVEFVNGRFSVYTKERGFQVKTMTDRQFWVSSGITLAAAVDITDPRIVFDRSSSRWFAVCVDLPVSSSDPNHFLLAVSVSADPTESWHAVSFQVDPEMGNFGDFPTLGIDAAGLYLGADMFDANQNNIGSSLTAIPKAALLMTTPDVSGRKFFGGLAFSHGDVLQPVVSLNTGVSEPADILAVSDVGFDGSPHSTLIASTFVGLTGEITLTSPQTVNVPPYILTEYPPQPDGTKNLDNGDCRFSATVYRVGNTIYSVQGTQVGQRGGIQWFKIDATSFALIDSGIIADTNLDLYYPSIAANPSGTVVIACNGSSSTTFISSYATSAEVAGGTLEFGPLQLLKAGVASYHDNDGSGSTRWGDYSATSPDPADPNRFWTIQLYAFSPNSWATQITELIVNPVSLSARLQGTSIVLTWSAANAGYELQQTPNFSPGSSWTTVGQTVSVVDGVASVTIPTTGAEGYFRLVKP